MIYYYIFYYLLLIKLYIIYIYCKSLGLLAVTVFQTLLPSYSPQCCCRWTTWGYEYRMIMLSAEAGDYPTNTQCPNAKQVNPSIHLFIQDMTLQKKKSLYPTSSVLALLLELTTNPYKNFQFRPFASNFMTSFFAAMENPYLFMHQVSVIHSSFDIELLRTDLHWRWLRRSL